MDAPSLGGAGVGSGALWEVPSQHDMELVIGGKTSEL